MSKFLMKKQTIKPKILHKTSEIKPFSSHVKSIHPKSNSIFSATIPFRSTPIRNSSILIKQNMLQTLFTTTKFCIYILTRQEISVQKHRRYDFLRSPYLNHHFYGGNQCLQNKLKFYQWHLVD